MPAVRFARPEYPFRSIILPPSLDSTNPQQHTFKMQRPDFPSLHPVPYSPIFARILAACISLILVLFPAPSSRSKHKSQTHREALKAVSLINKILIFPGRISHTRLFPKNHSFTYSYLIVGIPLHSHNNKGTRLLSVDDERAWWKRGWLRVEAADHLGRGGNEKGIYRKLQAYLESQVWRYCYCPE